MKSLLKAHDFPDKQEGCTRSSFAYFYVPSFLGVLRKVKRRVFRKFLYAGHTFVSMSMWHVLTFYRIDQCPDQVASDVQCADVRLRRSGYKFSSGTSMGAVVSSSAVPTNEQANSERAAGICPRRGLSTEHIICRLDFTAQCTTKCLLTPTSYYQYAYLFYLPYAF